MGATFHMPCPLKQWFSTCHCPTVCQDYGILYLTFTLDLRAFK